MNIVLAAPPSGTSTGGLYVETWGDGTPVVLVHGSLALGNDEWEAQRPLASQGFALRVFDRRGYGRSAAAIGEDFLADADDIGELMGPGAHLVGHSYGGLGAMLAAARHPERTLSLTLLEPPVIGLAPVHPAWRATLQQIRAMWTSQASDHDFVVAFLTAVGSDPEQLGPELLAAAVELVPVFRRGRPFFDAQLPLAELGAASFPKLVVAGGHHRGFDAMCHALARRIGGSLAIVEGAGHEIQFTGQPINDLLLRFWSRAAAQAGV
jgi:pimeloyl-ACP methyl ester carboxylesterase